MSELLDSQEGSRHLLMGNGAIARGALEAGVNVVASYPGTPSSEITENLLKVAKERNLYVEWSINEKVALEVAAAASVAFGRYRDARGHRFGLLRRSGGLVEWQ
jgi:indolepyruvate ferredoxin oxidoreductase alpha subunit